MKSFHQGILDKPSARHKIDKAFNFFYKLLVQNSKIRSFDN